MYTPVQSRMAGAYQRVNADSCVQDASPHRLIQLLFDALTQSLLAAQGAMERGDVVAKGYAIGKSVRLLEEGLKAGLSTHTGQTESDHLAQQLRDLYDHSIIRLTQANVRNDVKLIKEVRALIEPVASAWSQMHAPANGSSSLGG